MTQTFSDNNDSKSDPHTCSVCLRIGNIPLTKSMQETYSDVVTWHLKLDHNNDINSTIFKYDIATENS